MARGIIICGLLAVLQVMAAEEPQPLTALESALSDVKTVRTRFVQEKRMALFKKPLITKGAILLEMPDKLMWKVEAPIQYVLLIDGQRAKQWDGQTGKTVSIALADQPVFAAVTQQLRAWFAGNYRVLAKDYTIKKLEGEQLAFEFVPKPDLPQAKMLKRITVTFQKDKKYISLFQIEESGGDMTKMVFEETTINADIDKKEWNLP